MHDALVQYFAGEKQSAFAWGAAGVIAIVLALGVWRLANDYRAMAIPLAIVAVVQLGLAGGLWLRTDARVQRLEAELRDDPAQLTAAERTRIGVVNRAFVAIEIVEAILWITGVSLALAGLGRARPTMLAVGLGLFLQASAMLALDLAAARRARIYTSAIVS